MPGFCHSIQTVYLYRGFLVFFVLYGETREAKFVNPIFHTMSFSHIFNANTEGDVYHNGQAERVSNRT